MDTFTNLEAVENLIEEIATLEKAYAPDTSFFVFQATEHIVYFVENALKELQDKGEWLSYPLHFDIYSRSNVHVATFRYEDNSIGIYRPNVEEIYQQFSSRKNCARLFTLQVLCLLLFEVGKSERFNFSFKHVYLMDLQNEMGVALLYKISNWHFKERNPTLLGEYLRSKEFISTFNNELNQLYQSKMATLVSTLNFVNRIGHPNLDAMYQKFTVSCIERIKIQLYAILSDFFVQELHLCEHKVSEHLSLIKSLTTQ